MTAMEWIHIGKSICIFLTIFLLALPIAMLGVKYFLMKFYYIDLDLRWASYCWCGAYVTFLILLALMDMEKFDESFIIQIIPRK